MMANRPRVLVGISMHLQVMARLRDVAAVDDPLRVLAGEEPLHPAN